MQYECAHRVCALCVCVCFLQADWVVPSSREAVDTDNGWNQALRAELPAMVAR